MWRMRSSPLYLVVLLFGVQLVRCDDDYANQSWVEDHDIESRATECHSQFGTGPLFINYDGKRKSSHFLVTQGQVEITSKDSFTMSHGTVTYLTKKCLRALTQDMYEVFKLLGKTFQFTVDLSHAPCGCNVALYLAGMPSCNRGWKGDYYCDANGVSGEWCPEIDLMEANKASFQVAHHLCYGDHCSWHDCDTDGKYYNFRKNQESNWNRLNSNQPYDVANSFELDGRGNLVRIRTTIKQGGVHLEHVNDDQDYVRKLIKPLQQGMVLVMSYWGEGGQMMQWLDVPPCDPGVACNGRVNVPISNLKVTSN